MLLNIALDAGLEKNEVIEVLNSNLYDKQVEDDEQIAYTAGITGVPFYLFDGKYSIHGALSYDDFKKILIQLADEKHLNEDNEGKTCKDGVCKL